MLLIHNQANAVRLAELGLKIIPLDFITLAGTCSCGREDCMSNHPSARAIRNQPEAKGPLEVAGWWASGNWNVGVKTGRQFNCVALVVEANEGGYETLSRFEDWLGPLPATWRVHGGDGRTILVFNHPQDIQFESQRQLGHGVYLLAENRYFVAPSSTYPNGEVSVWAPNAGPNEIRLQGLPDQWVLGLQRDIPVGGATYTQPVAQGGDRFESTPTPTAQGSPEPALISPQVRVATDQSVARDANIQAPLPEARKFEPPSGCEYEAVVTQIAEETGLRFLTTGQLSSLPPPKWVIQDYLPEDACAVLVGPASSQKTFCALDVALHIATNRDWNGLPTQHGPVVYVAAESAKGLSPRIAAWLKYYEVKVEPKLLLLPLPVNLTDRQQTETFIKAMHLLPETPVLIVFDTLAKSIVGAEENSARDIGLVLNLVDTVRRECGGATVMLVHHTGKSNETERGSSALKCGVETQWRMDAVDNGMVSLKCDKQKDGPKFQPSYWKLHDVGNSAVPLRVERETGGTNEPPQDRRSQAILAALAAGPLRHKEIVSVTGIPGPSVTHKLAALKERGDVTYDAATRTYACADGGPLPSPVLAPSFHTEGTG